MANNHKQKFANIPSIVQSTLQVDASPFAITTNNLTKIYKLYGSPLDRLKEATNPFGKHYFTEFYALRDINLQIKRGDTVGIIGTNGSGKSTLLKLITGVLTPTSGMIKVNGKISALLELGAGFNPEMTGLENIYFNGVFNGYSKEEIDQRLDDILSFADIGNFVYQPVKTYSSGMFVRLAFAVAINVDPDILIVDEALSVGDIRFQRKCFAKINQFQERGKTILFVSHALDTVNLLCAYTYLIQGGKVVKQGLSKNVTRIYQKMMLGDHSENICPSMENDKSGYSDTTNIIDDLKEVVSYARTKINNWNGSKKAEIIDFGILDENGSKTLVLESGQKYTLFSRVLINCELATIHVGYPITNAKGVMLFGVNSELQQINVPRQDQGNIIEGRVEVTMWLAPGDYFLSFRAGTKDEEYDVLNDQIHFVVVGGKYALNSLSVVNLEPVVTVHNIEPAFKMT